MSKKMKDLTMTAEQIEKVEKYAGLQAEVTKLALDGYDKDTIKDYISNKYYYDLSPSIEEIKVERGRFSASCMATVPQALVAFLSGNDYCDVIDKAISIGGDCNTVAAMAGGIAFAYYKKIPEEILTHCLDCLDERLLNIYYKLKEVYID